MRTLARILIATASMVIAGGTLAACSSEGTETALSGGPVSPSATSAPSLNGTYVAQLPGSDGINMAIAVSIDGKDVVAYACNGTDEEAWFFGTHKDGSIDLFSRWEDNLKASLIDSNLQSTLTVNDIAYEGIARPAPAPAGAYTATVGDIRASWVVMPDQRMSGVMVNARRDSHVFDQIIVSHEAFKDRVRMTRLDRQMQQAPMMTYGSWMTHMNGSMTTAVQVPATSTELPAN